MPGVSNFIQHRQEEEQIEALINAIAGGFYQNARAKIVQAQSNENCTVYISEIMEKIASSNLEGAQTIFNGLQLIADEMAITRKNEEYFMLMKQIKELEESFIEKGMTLNEVYGKIQFTFKEPIVLDSKIKVLANVLGEQELKKCMHAGINAIERSYEEFCKKLSSYDGLKLQNNGEAKLCIREKFKYARFFPRGEKIFNYASIGEFIYIREFEGERLNILTFKINEQFYIVKDYIGQDIHETIDEYRGHLDYMYTLNKKISCREELDFNSESLLTRDLKEKGLESKRNLAEEAYNNDGVYLLMSKSLADDILMALEKINISETKLETIILEVNKAITIANLWNLYEQLTNLWLKNKF